MKIYRIIERTHGNGSLSYVIEKSYYNKWFWNTWWYEKSCDTREEAQAEKDKLEAKAIIRERIIK